MLYINGHDQDGEDDEMGSVPGQVQDGKIRAKWKVKYTE